MYKGTISKIFENNFGGKTLYSFALDGKQGVYFNCGEQRPDANEGDMVEFTATQKGSRLHVNFPINVLGKAQTAPATGKAGFSKGANSTSKDEYWTAKEARDIEAQYSMRYQGAYDRGLSLARLLIDTQAVKHPSEIRSMSDRAAYVKALVDECTAEIYHNTVNAKALMEGNTTSEGTPMEIKGNNEGDDWND